MAIDKNKHKNSNGNYDVSLELIEDLINGINSLNDASAVENFASKITFETRFNVRNVTAKKCGNVVSISIVFNPTNESFVEIGKIPIVYAPSDYLAFATRGHSSGTGNGNVGVYLQNNGTIGLISSSTAASSVTATVTFII